VADMVFKEDGSLVSSELYRAPVRNRAKLAYHSVAAWLTGTGPAPKRIAEVSGLDENLRLQGRVAQRGAALSSHRQKDGSCKALKVSRWATTFVSNSFIPMSNVVS
jgi:ribonuclease R